MAQKLFDDDFLKKLEYLAIVSKKVFAGKLRAQTRTKKVGWGQEFADHREYAPGDDLRYLDWNLYARVGELATKLFQEEENLNVYFLLDLSRSMDFGTVNKADFAKQIVAALAYIALANLDSVSIVPFSSDLGQTLPLLRGKGQILKIFDFLDQAPVGGQTDISQSVQTFLRQARGKGLAVVVSDFYDEAGSDKALKSLYHYGFDLVAVRVHHHREAEPKYRGAFSFTDAETDRVHHVTITGRVLRRYVQEYERFCEELRKLCIGVECTYLPTQTRVPFEEVVLQAFRYGRFIK
ncbi:MAG: DUF58 domain-containing protein [Candidatus Alcyoniella australis]|nr:DUF58 domain-containing protein [Candidatus Alcyoniella australis]